MTELDRALADLEATLASVWEQADAEYVARHFPWHNPGVGCAALPDHVHTDSHKVWYWPQPVEVWPP